MFIRSPVPCGPPVQPVLTSHAGAACSSRRSPSIRGVFRGAAGAETARRNRREKVAVGSSTPIPCPRASPYSRTGSGTSPDPAQAGDGRQDAERVGGEQDHVARVRGDAGGRRIADEPQRVGGPRVLGDRFRCEVELARHRVGGHVLDDRPEPAGRGEDVGLVHRRQPDRLRVAAALEVEQPVRRPSRARRRRSSVRSGSALSVVLPVPDRPKNSAASPPGPTFADECIGRTPSSGSRKFITVNDGLLDLARVHRADDEDLVAREVDQDRGLAAGAVASGIGLERGRADDREVRQELRSCSVLGSRNRLREKMLAQAVSV